MKCHDCGSTTIDLEPGDFVHKVDVRHWPPELSDDELDEIALEAIGGAVAAVGVHKARHKRLRDEGREKRVGGGG